jgi:predicted AAA+ superfamily ATPase
MYKLLPRDIYLGKIRKFIDDKNVKAITGIRRSGKSELLKLVKKEILEKTTENNIIYINFESSEFYDLKTYVELNSYIKKLMTNKEKYYVFLDEIQHVEN